MKPLRSTLTFVLGLFLGIIMLIVAIVGVVLGIGTTMTVKDMQDKTGMNVVGEESLLYQQNLVEAIQSLIGDIQSADTLSLKDLYDHYGIAVFKELSGLDLSQKEFYSRPLTEIASDWSILTNSLTLNDIGSIAKFDFDSYDMPILKENLNNGINTALDNILSSLDDDLSIRAINDKFGIDLGAADNALLSQLQDLRLSDFGSVIDVLRIDTLLEADTDTFVRVGAHDLYRKTDRYEEVSSSQLSVKTPATGAETYIAGAIDTDDDGEMDAADERELRYINKDGEYVVDNSCYEEEHENKTYYRHLLYEKSSTATAENYILGYANRVATVNGEEYTLFLKGFVRVDELFNGTVDGSRTPVTQSVSGGKVTITNGDLCIQEGESFVEAGRYAITAEELTTDSRLSALEKEATASVIYRKIHNGTATPALQAINYYTIGELRESDDFIKNITIGELIDVNKDGTSKIIQQLKDSTLDTIGQDVDNLTLEQILDIVPYGYNENANGKYVEIVEENGSHYYALYNQANPEHQGKQRYDRVIDPAVHNYSSAVLQRFAGATLGSLSDAFNGLLLSDVLDIDTDFYTPAAPELLEQFKAGSSDARIYYYDAELQIYRVETPEDMTAHGDEREYFVLSQKGETEVAVLRKLAFVKVDDLPTAMDKVLDEMFLDELIDIAKFYQVEKSDTGTDKYLVEWDKKTVVDKTGKTVEIASELQDGDRPVVYVLNSGNSGPYILRNYKYVLLDDTQDAGKEFDINGTPFYYEFKAVGTKETVTQKATTLNLFYKNDSGEYIYNQQLVGYFVFQVNKTGGNQQLLNKLYYCEKKEGGSDADLSQENVGKGYLYDENANLFVDQLGETVAYAKENIVHWFMKKYYKQEGGGTNYFVDKNNSLYKYEQGTDLTYAQKFCEDVYVKAEEGNYVYVDGAYVTYDADVHAGATRYEIVKGYIAEHGEVFYTKDTEQRMPVGTFNRVNVTVEKSSNVLIYLANSTVNGMSDSIEKATLGDIIEITPDSIFDNDELRGAKLSEIAEKMQDIFTGMKLGELLTLANITTVAPAVRDALVDMTLPEFFGCLKYDGQIGIYVDILSYLDKTATPMG